MVPSGLRKPGLRSVKSYWTSPSTGDPWGPDLLQLRVFCAKLSPNRECSVLESPQVSEFLFPIGLNFISTNTLKWAIKATGGTEPQELRQSKGCFPHRFSTETIRNGSAIWVSPQKCYSNKQYVQRHLWNCWDRSCPESRRERKSIPRESSQISQGRFTEVPLDWWFSTPEHMTS